MRKLCHALQVKSIFSFFLIFSEICETDLPLFPIVTVCVMVADFDEFLI